MRPSPWFAALVLSGGACSMATTRMERALDASMERSIIAVNYVQTAAGVTADTRRLVRSDGYLYMADVAPQLRYLVMTGDAAAYRAMRRIAERDLVRRDSTGLVPRRRYRAASAFEMATTYDALRFDEALALGWRTFGDTASAVLAAQLAPVAPVTGTLSETDQVAEQCAVAEAAAGSDPKAAAATLAKYRRYAGAAEAAERSVLGLRGGDASLVALACMTRLGLAVQDPDATVHFLDRLLDRLDPMIEANGRPDPGAGSDILLALRQALSAGTKK